MKTHYLKEDKTNIMYTEEPLVPPNSEHLGMVEQIWESDYDEKNGTYIFRIFFNTGKEATISIATNTIEKIIINKKL